MSNEKAKNQALSIIPADSSIRLEYTIDDKGGLFLEVRGLNFEANSANSHTRFQGNDVESIFLYKIKVDTLPPHDSLSNENYPFGLIIFSHLPLTEDQYVSFAKMAMQQILPNFIKLYNHSHQSIRPFMTTPTSQNSANQAVYNTSHGQQNQVPNVNSQHPTLSGNLIYYNQN